MSILLADIDATCAALGYSDGKKYQAEPDAVQGLKHLIWILRRDMDHHEYRRHLGRSKVLQTDLVYMLPDYIGDDEFADVLIRLLVILTNPTLLLYRDGPPKDNHERKVFLELIDILQGYKTAFAKEAIWTALFGKMQKALEIDWALRSEEQNLLIERILVLIRNVLQVPANPELECRTDNDASVHDQLIWVLHRSGILDLMLFIISSPDEHQFHLHGLEILCLLYREQTAASLADASLQRSASEKQRDEQELIAVRRREKQRQISKPPPARHSRFGGTYVIRNMKSVSDRDIICHQPLERAVTLDFDREKEQQKKSFRHIKEEKEATRRSAFSVRLCLREYCIEVLRSAYNTLVRQVRRVLERNSGSTSHDDSYLLWAIRFFMEFNRLSGLQLPLVSESLSVQCFHWVLTRMQHDMDMITSDKKQARLWAKRLHVALQTFRELLQSMLALQKLEDVKARALFDMLLNNVCYVLEYRETILHLLMNYNESHSTKAFLRDIVEAANIFIKMMEKFCKDSVLVQDKRRTKKKASGKKTKKPTLSPEETEEQLANRWAELGDEISSLLAGELQLSEQNQPLPFDATSEKGIDDQKEDCMIRIHKFLRESKLEQAISLLRSAREVWPENDVFGSITAAPEDELLLLREIFLHNIGTVDSENNHAENGEDGSDDNEDNVDDEENEEYENDGMVEKTFKFDDFAKRLLNPRIVRACTVVLADWEQIPTRSLKAAVTILHRIAYGCSCPAMLYQATLFRIFQRVFHAPRDAHQEELRRLGIFIVRKFVETAPSNPKIFAELLFYKSIKDANELESGYCHDAYEAGTKGTWTEEQETELRLLFEENQRNPETDKDVIDWILENLINKNRTRRGVLKKLKEMGLMFKAPTKKSSASTAASKNLWRSEEDEELRSLYDEHRTEPDCLQRILNEFGERRNKQQIIRRMLQLHMIADKSEILPKKQRKRKQKKTNANSGESADESDKENGRTSKNRAKTAKPKKTKPGKPKQRKIVRTPLDIGTVRALIAQVDAEKYEGAIDWLGECLTDAAEDCEEPSEEDDGVPLVPLFEVQKAAMEDDDFKKVLVALGLQPPIAEMETYWRIPIYLNASDLQLRAKILAGEELEIDLAGIKDDNDASDHEGNNELPGDDDDDDDDDDEDDDDNQDGESSEEDYFDSVKRKQEIENYIDERCKQMENLMFSKSDEEDEQRQPIGKEKAKRKPRQKGKKAAKKQQLSDESDDDMDVDEIQKKLDRRQKNIERGKKSSDEESADEEDKPSKSAGKSKAKTSSVEPEKNLDNLFDQLKSQRASKKKLVEVTTDVANISINIEESDELNFNSEDYRKRLLELGDSDEDGNVDDDDDDDDVDGKNKTVVDERAKQTSTNNYSSTSKNRSRRANIIDSDSDAEDNLNIRKDGVKDVRSNNTLAGDDIVDNISNQAIDEPRALTEANNKKRRRSEYSDMDDAVNNNVDSDDEEEEETLFIKRKKPTKEEQLRAITGEEPSKRRRIAIIDDDDDNDF